MERLTDWFQERGLLDWWPGAVEGLPGGWRFASPLWLLLIPLLIALHWRLYSRRRQQAAILFSSTRLVRRLPRTWRWHLRRLVRWMQLAAWLALVLALARPQQGVEALPTRESGISIAMCIDRSGSMAEQDFVIDGERVDRLTAVKWAFRNFVLGNGADLTGRDHDLIGLIAFGGYVDDLCPLTFDHDAVIEILETVEIPRRLTDSQGTVINEEDLATAIGDAILTAVDRLKEVDSESRVLILLSDGANTAGIADPEVAAETARAFGIRIYSIGVGGASQPVQSPFDIMRSGMLPARSDVDEAALRRLATITGGRYFHAADAGALQQVYAEIDELEKTELEGLRYVDYREYFDWPLECGFWLLGCGLLIQGLFVRGLP